MINTELNGKFKEEAIRIGEELIEKSKKDEFGLFWETMGTDSESNIYFKESENIYSGVSGIILFFIALYKVTKNEKYVEVIESSLNWTYNFCKNNKTTYYAFYTGRLGVSYVLLKWYLITKNEKYKKDALEIAKGCDSFLENQFAADDLINGLSGTILGLIYIHNITKENWLLGLIEKFTEKLIESAFFAENKGLYWDRSYKQIKGLCGYSHGAAGIGYVFLELSKYFQNPSFLKISKLAFHYENCNYSEEFENWPDLRQSLFSKKDIDERKELYLKGELESFFKGKDMNAWCHGAAGIGHSRLEAYNLLKEEVYKKDVENALRKVIKRDVKAKFPDEISYTLCHGGGGNADLLIEAYLNGYGNECIENAKKIGENALNSRKKHHYFPGFHFAKDSEDLSLFMGNAGIGYFYLRLVNPEIVESVLSIKIDGNFKLENKESLLNVEDSKLTEKLLSKPFKKTMTMLKTRKIDLFNSLMGKISKSNENILDSFVNSFKLNEKDLEKEINEIFNYELTKLQCDFNCKSHSLNFITDLINSEKIQNEFCDLESKKILMHQNCQIVELDYNLFDNEEITKEKTFVLLKVLEQEVKEFPIDEFCYSIISEAKEPINYISLQSKILEMFGEITDEQKYLIKNKIKQQVEALLKGNILIFSDL